MEDWRARVRASGTCPHGVSIRDISDRRLVCQRCIDRSDEIKAQVARFDEEHALRLQREAKERAGAAMKSPDVWRVVYPGAALPVELL